MYCIKCGVKLSDTEKCCPLCQTRVYHPDLALPEAEPLYPKNALPDNPKAARVFPALLTVLWVMGILVVLLCDLQVNRAVTWSAYVMGAMAAGYVSLVLPGWFQKPNPVIFVPCAFAANIGYLLLIDLISGGGWFLPFALPVAGGVGLIVTALVTLLRYVKKGRLFTVGGTLLALGLFMLPAELLLSSTFRDGVFYGWSLYPLLALVTLGGCLIFLGICRPAREAMERKFFF